MNFRRKIVRELNRVFRLSHWRSLVAFRLRLVQARLMPIPGHTSFADAIGPTHKKTHVIAFVVYCPAGIRPDTQRVLADMSQAANTRLLVIINHTLTAQDETFLGALDLAYVQGDNLGYDFGAYRDACLTMVEDQIPCGRFTLMNDSFVFPLSGPTLNLFDYGEPAPFSGLIEQGDRKKIKQHLCSFCLTFDRDLVRSQVFADFWKGFKPLPDWLYSVKVGEVGLSLRLAEAGVAQQVAYGKDRLLKALAESADDTLPTLGRLLQSTNIYSKGELNSFLDKDAKTQRKGVERAIRTSENLRLTPVFSFLCDMPFVKRRSLQAHPLMAAWYQETYGLDPEAWS